MKVPINLIIGIFGLVLCKLKLLILQKKMEMENADYVVTKFCLLLGSATLIGIPLYEWDMLLGIILKAISILSFSIVAIINIDKVPGKIKKYYQKIKSLFK